MDSGVLKQVDLFADVSEEALEKIAVFVAMEQVSAGKAIVREGDFANAMYVIDEGEVEVTRDGQTLATMGKGDVFGEQGLLEKEPRSATVTATEPTRLFKIENWELSRMRGSMPEVVAELQRKVEERSG